MWLKNLLIKIGIIKPKTDRIEKPDCAKCKVETIPVESSIPKIPSKTKLLVIDISHHNGTLDWDAIKRSGEVDAVWAKATQGKGFKDPQYKRNCAEAKRVGIPFGAYLFFDSTHDPVVQYKTFMAHTENMKDCSLVPMFDWEINKEKVATQAPKAALILESLAVFMGNGKLPLIYSGSWFFEGIGYPPTQFAKYPYWESDYRTLDKIDFPKPWTSCKIWQYTENGSISGVKSANGKFDLNICYGDIASISR